MLAPPSLILQECAPTILAPGRYPSSKSAAVESQSKAAASVALDSQVIGDDYARLVALHYSLDDTLDIESYRTMGDWQIRELSVAHRIILYPHESNVLQTLLRSIGHT